MPLAAQSAFQNAPVPLRVTQLRLQNFRNYRSAELSTDKTIVVLSGANGSGKTNLLEALSLLTPGRGLRRAPFQEMASQQGPGSWSVSADLMIGDEEVKIGTGLMQMPADDESAQRQIRINGMPAGKARTLSDYVAALWLTPDNDGLFRGPAGDRRRFLDRLALALDPSHGTRVNSLEKLLRSRNKLLCEAPFNEKWLDAIEHDLAEAAVAVAAGRLLQMESLNTSIMQHRDPASPFPHAVLSLEGEIEHWLASCSGIEAEDRYREILCSTRAYDAAAGRTTRGAHLSDFLVEHGPKAIPAAQGSTGEQKALLIGLILAQTRHVAELRGAAPLLLLDEISAHLDALRRAALYDELENLGAQAWLTGTDAGMFEALQGRAAFIEVVNGNVRFEDENENAPKL